MKKLELKSFVIMFTLSFMSICKLYSQESIDTLYYDSEWKGVANKTFAKYYRIAIYPENANYKKLCRDYYITGEVQGEGEFISIDKYDDSKSIWEGKCVTYHKNGKISAVNNLKNGIANGEFYSYSEDGLVKHKGIMENGKLNGLYTEFLDDGTYMQAEYTSGKPSYDYYIVGNQDGQVVKLAFSDNKPIWETPSIEERETFHQDGTPWQYYVKNGITIYHTNTTTKDYGKWHRIDLYISNNSLVPIEFNPEEHIKAHSINKKDVATNLEVWSCDEYMKKVNRAQTWTAIAVGVSEGLSTSNAGYSTSTTNTNSSYNGTTSSYGTASAYGNNGYAYGSYRGNSSYSGSSHTTSSTTTYDASAAYQAQVLSQQRMADFSAAQYDERNTKQMGYLKRNTIYPGESIQGYVHIKRISGETVYISVFINDAEHQFGWSY